ncbi:hypothetical protein [Elizabethkingia sp. JS20170427COW]|uniref:hypothetical protein n=1 Tax=Elizabethkingia sp. JS20170427COW TaxID=2583851 RepID=UPI00110FFEB9|nr:hypothetical protein [Elizabethkingia sp. JS20170427COW]QCX53281.1 hypothetical protein FGE20_05810 [Elizabethkingia sp. JS20170427COW]
MKYFKFLILSILLVLVSCKKDRVDGSSLKSFQSSINDMASQLTTIQQIKFNEALYIIKQYGTKGTGDVQKMTELAQMLEGKNVKEILAMADGIAQREGIEWASNAPPSLGEMNIFANTGPTEIDFNDISASALSINIKPTNVDSTKGAQAIMVVPRLINDKGEEVQFSNAALETVMEVYSGGVKLSTSKNLMVNNNFKGFYLSFKKLSFDKIVDNMIDVKVSVKTTKKTFQLTKTGVSLNPAALAVPEPVVSDSLSVSPSEIQTGIQDPSLTTVKPLGDPKESVSRFIRNVGAKNLKAAYEMSNNPSWGSYDAFANPSSGFGAVKSIQLKGTNTVSQSQDQATVNASYIVTDNNGKSIEIDASYTLRASADGWKISGYRINSSK